jgi:Na+/melibiose symporter-like transporter
MTKEFYVFSTGIIVIAATILLIGVFFYSWLVEKKPKKKLWFSGALAIVSIVVSIFYRQILGFSWDISYSLFG